MLPAARNVRCDLRTMSKALGSDRRARGDSRIADSFAAGLALACFACVPPEDEHWADTAPLAVGGGPAESGAGDARAIQVPPPPLSEGVFPCSDCHDPEIPVNTRRRKLSMAHQEIELKHDEEHRWCLDCHDANDRDQLHLASGEKVPFEESYRLCGQCHGDKLRDWRAGVHGRRTGRWDGEKQYLLCVHCHNSHAPAFAPLKPMPPPPRPVRTP
jgi:hypothetical protein